jgi:anti-anti-sigma regulatory factor
MSEPPPRAPRFLAGEQALVVAVDRPVLGADLDLSEALEEAATAARDLVLDLAGVEEVDLRGMQLLAGGRRRLREHDRCLILRNVASDVRRTLELAGLEGEGAPRAGAPGRDAGGTTPAP